MSYLESTMDREWVLIIFYYSCREWSNKVLLFISIFKNKNQIKQLDYLTFKTQIIFHFSCNKN